MAHMIEVLIEDADGDEFPIGFPGRMPTAKNEIALLKDEAIARLRLYAQQGHVRPTEPLAITSVRER